MRIVLIKKNVLTSSVIGMIIEFYSKFPLDKIFSLYWTTFIKTIGENYWYTVGPARSYRNIIQCVSLKCRPQYGGQRWQLLTAQVPAGKSKAIPPLHGGLKLSKITKKNNHVPYNMRC